MAASMRFGWTALSTSGQPPPRLQGFTATADTGREVAYVFGGRTPHGLSGRLHVVDLGDGTTPPTGSQGASHGRASTSAKASTAVRGAAYSTAHWAPVDSIPGEPPRPREGHAAVLTGDGDLVVIGGDTGRGEGPDEHGVFHILTLGSGRAAADDGAGGFSAEARSSTVAFAGIDADTNGQPTPMMARSGAVRAKKGGDPQVLGGDNHRIGSGGGPRWVRRVTVGTLPAARMWHSACAVTDASTGARMVYLFGGREVGSNPHDALPDDLYILNVDGNVWTRVERPRGTGTVWPSGRQRATLTETRSGKLILTGGFNAKGNALRDMYMLDCAKMTWRLINPATTLTPSARGGHSAASMRSTTRVPGASTSRFLVVFGGSPSLAALRSGTACADGCMAFHFAQREWVVPHITGTAPRSRGGHVGFVIGSRMFILGGEMPNGEDTAQIYAFEEVAGQARVTDQAIKKLAASEIESMRERCRLERETGSAFGHPPPATGVDDTLNRDFQIAKYKSRVAHLEQDLAHHRDLAAERGKDVARLSREVDRLATKLSDTRDELKTAKRTAAALSSNGTVGGGVHSRSARGKSGALTGGGSGTGGDQDAQPPLDESERQRLLALREALAVRENALRAGEARLEARSQRASDSVEAYNVAARERAALQKRLNATMAANARVKDNCADLGEKVQRLTHEMSELSLRVRTETARAHSLSQSLARERARVQVCESELSTLRADQSETIDVNANATDDTGGGGGKSAKRQNTSASASKGGDRKKEAASAELERLREESARDRENLELAQAEVVRLGRLADELKRRLDGSIGTATLLESKAAGAESRAAEAEAALEPTRAERDALARRVAQLEAEIAAAVVDQNDFALYDDDLGDEEEDYDAFDTDTVAGTEDRYAGNSTRRAVPPRTMSARSATTSMAGRGSPLPVPSSLARDLDTARARAREFGHGSGPNGDAYDPRGLETTDRRRQGSSKRRAQSARPARGGAGQASTLGATSMSAGGRPVSAVGGARVTVRPSTARTDGRTPRVPSARPRPSTARPSVTAGGR